ncbi:CoF synthetase [uncultured Flavobacterium sp.]|uniref:CoF synthetase n=1 Tax=uncultured Flavobacterium sp. TaxID=165435 RepID=UPI0025F552C6|nr:CoF synthetase [uncultured Flavobacterium sp.]
MLNFRNVAFKTLDSVKGSSVKKEILNVEEGISGYEASSKKREERLAFLCDWAKNNVPYYSALNPGSFENFPVINKNIIKENLDSFIDKKLDKESLFKMVTSGSTGTPFTSYQDKKKKVRNTADTMVFASMADFTIGNKLFYFKIWNDINKKSGLSKFIENIVPVDVTNQSETELMKFVTALQKNEYGNIAFLGYASYFEALIKIMDKFCPDARITCVKSAITMSEALDPTAKEKFRKYFGINIYSRYSNMENGIIAQQVAESGNSFLVNWSSYVLEIYDFDKEVPLAYGEKGRIVVTDLYNTAMPFIKYDTGDIGIMEWSDALKQPVLSKVEGRKMDLIYNVDGELVSSFIITNNMWYFTEILQYQFIQLTETEYKFILNVGGDFARERELVELFSNILGSTASIAIEYVSEIPLLNSGKRKKVMSYLKK